MEGTLSVQPQSNPVKGFEEYFLNLNVQNNTRNPWFIGKFTICISTINCIAENLLCRSNSNASKNDKNHIMLIKDQCYMQTRFILSLYDQFQ